MKPFVDLFIYDGESGRLMWRVSRRGRGCIAGSPAGTPARRKDTSYLAVSVNYRKLYAHRIVWEMHNGEIPAGMCIDHIDGNGLNNRIANLRLVTLSQNQRNSRKPANNKTGVVGVYLNRAGGYWAQLGNRRLGIYKTIDEAASARAKASAAAGFHPNHGRG